VLAATVAFDLDLVMTSHELWGTYISVPSLAIYRLHHQNGVYDVQAFPFLWGGAALRGAAIAILEPVLGTFEQTLGKEHPCALRTAHNLGVANLEDNRPAESGGDLRSFLETASAPSAPDIRTRESAVARRASGR
jgi:hypothetical protein